MSEFLNESKDFGTQATRSTFYVQQSFGGKSTTIKSKVDPISKENMFGETRSSFFLNKTSTAWKPSYRPPTVPQKQRHSTLEKIKTLSIKLNFQNKLGLWNLSNKSRDLSSFLVLEWPNLIELNKRDQILKKLFAREDFSMKAFSLYLAENFGMSYLKLSDVINHLEGVPLKHQNCSSSKVVTKNQVLEIVLPQHHYLRACLLAKNRSDGMFKNQFSLQTKMILSKALRDSLEN